MKDSNSQSEIQYNQSWISYDFINSITPTSWITTLAVLGSAGFISYGCKIANDIRIADSMNSDLPWLHQKVINYAELVAEVTSYIVPEVVLTKVSNCCINEYILFAITIAPANLIVGGTIGAAIGVAIPYIIELSGKIYDNYYESNEF